MTSIKDVNKLKEIFRRYDYVMTAAELNAEKIYYADIQQLIDDLIEKVKRGYYHWIDASQFSFSLDTLSFFP